MTLLEIIRQVAARIAAAREEFDPLVREQMVEDLEHDVAGWLAAYEERAAA
jgi:hypothetical protein